jgi:O-Antigen ligase
MTTNTLRRTRKPRAPVSVWIPSRKIEYAYYLVFSYSIIAAYLGVEVPLLAALIITALGGFCLVKMGSRAKEVYAPIALLLACQISFILVQVAAHGVSVMDAPIRNFILWICGMIIVQSLCLRPGFLHRCTIVIFAAGLIAVPHLAFTTSDIVERARADIQIGGGLQNADGLAVWFGFCVVSFGISALETKRGIVVRILYGLAAVGSLLIVGLTVSRGAMFGAALAITVAFRGLLRRGFVPVLLLIILTGVIYESGLFDQAISRYAERGMEETGRFLLWPYVVERIFNSPIVGVGFSNISTYIPEVTSSISTPHNSFLFFALSSGVLPLAFWVSFWIGAASRSFSDDEQSEYRPFRIPLLLYALVAFMFSDISTELWALLTLAVGAGSGISLRRERLLVTHRRIRRRRMAPTVQLPSRAKTIQ